MPSRNSVLFAIALAACAMSCRATAQTDLSAFSARVKSELAAESVRQAQTLFCKAPLTTAAQDNSVAGKYREAAAELECARKLLAILPPLSAAAGASATITADLSQLLTQDIEAKTTIAEGAKANIKFLGFNWGAGIGYGFGIGPKRIGDAEVINGIVRVKEDRTDGIRAVAEAHHFFNGKEGKFGWGPFAAVQLGKDGASAVAFSLGMMVGWKDQGPVDSAGSWNLGIGYEFGQDVKVLGDGIVPNQPLPAGEEAVRFKTRPADAILVFFSRRFHMEAIE